MSPAKSATALFDQAPTSIQRSPAGVSAAISSPAGACKGARWLGLESLSPRAACGNVSICAASPASGAGRAVAQAAPPPVLGQRVVMRDDERVDMRSVGQARQRLGVVIGDLLMQPRLHLLGEVGARVHADHPETTLSRQTGDGGPTC